MSAGSRAESPAPAPVRASASPDLESGQDEQEGESKGYLTPTSPNTSSVNEECAWLEECECPDGTTIQTCACERWEKYKVFRYKCTCSTLEMVECTCVTCPPQFSHAKRAAVSRKFEKDCTCDAACSIEECVCGAVAPDVKRAKHTS